MTDVLAEVIRVARTQIGYNGQGTEDAPLTKYGAWYGYQDQWCAMFVSWCAFMAGAPYPASTARGFMYCPDGVRYAKDRGWWLGRVYQPQVGDVVFYDYGLGRPSHVGLVEYSVPAGFDAIEGNTTDRGQGRTGNCVRRKNHFGNDPYIVGFARPDWAQLAKEFEENDVKAEDIAAIADAVGARLHLPKTGLAVPKGQVDNGNLYVNVLGELQKAGASRAADRQAVIDGVVAAWEKTTGDGAGLPGGTTVAAFAGAVADELAGRLVQ